MNLVLSKQFREALEDAMVRHTTKQITPTEMITKLLDLARWVREAQKHGRELGLTGNHILRRARRERVGQGRDEVGYAAPDGPRVGGGSEAPAQARLDAAQVGAGRPAPPPLGEIRLSPRSVGRRHATGAE